MPYPIKTPNIFEAFIGFDYFMSFFIFIYTVYYVSSICLVPTYSLCIPPFASMPCTVTVYKPTTLFKKVFLKISIMIPINKTIRCLHIMVYNYG